MLFLSFVLTCLTSLSALAAAATSMNDVTYLLPIPKSAADLNANYINAMDIVGTGPLVSSANLSLFDWSKIQPDLDLRERANIDRLAVVGVRLDPCFKDLFSEACRPQIRLVMQPIDFTTGVPKAGDLGVHLFFDTSREEIVQLIRFASDYRAKTFGDASSGAPLQIHPVVSQQGAAGAFWSAMRPQILNVLNSAAKSRIAFFTVFPSLHAWMFESFNLNGSSASAIAIAGIGSTIERIQNRAQTAPHDFLVTDGTLPAKVGGTDQTFDYLQDSVSFRRSGTGRTNPLVNSLERIENPTMHLPGTIDCLSCHSTPSIKESLRRSTNPLLRSNSTFVSSTLPAAALLNITEESYQSNDFRLFGFRNSNPIIGQRVINETASIIDSLAPELSVARARR